MRKIFKFIGFFASVLLIFIIISTTFYFLVTKDAKLDLSKLSGNEFVLEFYSDKNEKIAEKSMKNGGKPVKLSELNDYTINAFIAVEDRRFYSHNGIDLKRIIGASIQNLKSLSFKEGASTITQQLVKNTHLSSEKTLKRKLSEIKIALELENRYTKDEILESYLNTIYFGQGAYGIENASIRYFNKPASKLTLNESAMLAGIIKAPSKYSPIENYDSSIERKNLVLKLMAKYGYITNEEYQSIKNQSIIVIKNSESPYEDYVNAVINEYESLSIFNPYNNKNIKIYTYLDEDLQRDIYEQKTDSYSVSKIAINSINSGIIAFYGNNFNLKRSPASCIKPWLVYAPMINDNYIKESSVILDEPINYNGYSPKNYGDKYYGNVTAKTALSKSLNVPAVKLLNGYGIENANNYTKKMGLDIKNESLSCALGSLSTGLTLKELCDNYSPFNNQGKFKKSTFIKKIVIGNVNAYFHVPKSVEVFSPETAFIVSDMLRDAVLNGNSKKLRDLPYDVYAKTGTNGNGNGNIDALSVSYTSDKIIGVWIGNEDNSLMDNSITGSNQPTLITRDIYEKIYKNTAPSKIPVPSTVERAEIDIDYLLNEKIETLKDGGESFYYSKGTKPKMSFSSTLKPLISNPKISLNSNIVKLNFTVNNADFIEIIKSLNGKSTVIYSGLPISVYSDYLTKEGVYSYKLIAYKNSDKEEYNFNKINYKKSSSKFILNDDWLHQ